MVRESGATIAFVRCDRRTLTGIGLVALAIALAFQGARPLHETSEGRYGLVAQEILHSGNWLEPTLNGRAHWTKPPLTYWAMAAGMSVFGQNAWGVRAPGAVAHALTAVLVACLGAMLLDVRTGKRAGYIYGLAWLPQAAAHTATTDVYLALFTTAAVGAFAASVAAEGRTDKRRWMSLMWCAFGFAFLTKGPAGLLPLLAVIAWRMALPRAQRPPWLTWSGALGFVMLGFGWYFVEILKHPDLPSRLFSIAVDTNILGQGAHNQEWWKGVEVFGPPLLFAVGLPGLAALAQALRRLKMPLWSSWWQERNPRLFLVLWVLFPLAVFMTVGNKLPLYVTQLAAPLALLTAIVLAPVCSRHGLTVLLSVSTLLFLAGKAVFAYTPSRRDMLALAREVEATMRAGGARHASIALATRRPLYGLQFYVGGELFRPADDGSRKEIDAFIEELLHRYEQGGFANGLLFVASERDVDQVGRLVTLTTGEATDHHGRFWHCLLLPAQESTESRTPKKAPDGS